MQTIDHLRVQLLIDTHIANTSQRTFEIQHLGTSHIISETLSVCSSSIKL